jgi:ribosomal protein S2
MSYIKGKVLFVATKWLYSRIIYDRSYLSLPKELIYRKPGVFSNFSYLSDIFFEDLDFNKNPSVLVFFRIKDKDYLVLEAKKKKIPIVGLISSKTNSLMVDYPIFINSEHFHATYFFSRFLFKLIFVGKNNDF